MLERPEIVCWEMEEYARVLAAAKEEGPEWFAAVCLAGEAGLRVGEVRALRWGEDVDLVAGTITVNQQTRRGIIGTPKGRTRRTIPMTPLLEKALTSLQVVRQGYVVRPLDDDAGEAGLLEAGPQVAPDLLVLDQLVGIGPAGEPVGVPPANDAEAEAYGVCLLSHGVFWFSPRRRPPTRRRERRRRP